MKCFALSSSFSLKISGRILLAFVLIGFSLLSSAPTWAAGPYNYTYDAVGRVIAMTDGAGNAVEYDYDAVGNLIAIKQLVASSVSIIDFTPHTGTDGTGVTITGTGFSATPNLNTVNFNGLGATVSAATSNQLVVTAPVGVTTGLISVTTPLGSATSSTSFLVGGALLSAPTITSFTPTIGISGTTVTVTGTNFDTGLGRTKVRFNQTPAYNPSVTSTTNLTTVVPTNAASGKIRVTTPAGYVDSVADFIIPPPSIAAADIVDIQRILVGGTQTLNITPANKVGLLLFDGSSNTYLTLNITALTTVPAASPVAYQVYSPNGALLASGSVSGARSITMPRLPQTGTYSIYFKPGAATATLSMALVADPVLAIALDGVPSNVTLAMVGQQAWLTFTGSAGQNLELGITGLTLSPASSTYADVFAYNPDGSPLNATTCYTTDPGCGLNLSNLPVNGTYSVAVTPAAGGTGSFTATLSSDVTGVLTAGTPLNLNLSRAGQNGRLTFSGNAGDYSNLALMGVTVTPAGSGTMYVYNPNGAYLTSLSFSNGSTTARSLPVLPTTGTYTVLINPDYAATASMTLLLTSTLQVPLILDGAPSNITLAAVGQTARLTFTGSVGQNLGLGITGLTLSPVNSTNAYVYRPDGSYLNATTCYTADPGCEVSLSNLPMNGTYSVVVTPAASGTGSFTATLSSDVTGVLTAGTPLNLNLSRAGQNGRLTFSGNAGDYFNLALMGVTVTPAGSGTMYVYKPNGAYLTSLSFSNGGTTAQSLVLPTTGTYTVLIKPNNAATVSMALLLTPPLQVPLTLDGAPSNVTLATAGQPVQLTFNGSVGQNLGLGITGLTLSLAGSTSADVAVYRPDGVLINFRTCYTTWPGCELNLSNLPMNGTYSVVVTPAANGTGSFTATLSSDVAGVLTAGTPLNLNLSRAGQNGRLTFSGNAGTTPGLTFSAINTNPAGQNVTFTASIGVYSYTSSTGGAAIFNFLLYWLPATGTYTLLIDPSYAATATLSVTLSP